MKAWCCTAIWNWIRAMKTTEGLRHIFVLVLPFKSPQSYRPGIYDFQACYQTIAKRSCIDFQGQLLCFNNWKTRWHIVALEDRQLCIRYNSYTWWIRWEKQHNFLLLKSKTAVKGIDVDTTTCVATPAVLASTKILIAVATDLARPFDLCWKKAFIDLLTRFLFIYLFLYRQTYSKVCPFDWFWRTWKVFPFIQSAPAFPLELFCI